jgi:hypothetical protein
MRKSINYFELKEADLVDSKPTLTGISSSDFGARKALH